MQTLRTILIVDDHVELREGLEEFLQLEGYKTVTARHGQEALAVMAQMEHSWVVLTDLTMPTMDGSELARQIASCYGPRRVPVILMTGSAPDALLEEQLFWGYLRKPLNLDSLLDVLETTFANLHGAQQGQVGLVSTTAAM